MCPLSSAKGEKKSLAVCNTHITETEKLSLGQTNSQAKRDEGLPFTAGRGWGGCESERLSGVVYHKPVLGDCEITAN